MNTPFYLTDALLPNERAQIITAGRDPDDYVVATGIISGGIPYTTEGALVLDLRVHTAPVVAEGIEPAEICFGVGEVRVIVAAAALTVATPAAVKGRHVHVAQLRWPTNAQLAAAMKQLGFARDVSGAPPACVEVVAWTRAEALAWVSAMVALGAEVTKPPLVTLWMPAGGEAAPVPGLAELPEQRTPGVYLAPLP
jgi:hypothetical protein